MNILPHQRKASRQLTRKLEKYGMAILSGEPRSGKTISFLSVLRDYNNPLIITQKAAIKDIQEQAAAIDLHHVTVTNYHQAKKIDFTPDIIVLDECHRWVTGYPKRSTIWKELHPITHSVPIIFSSGTLTPEGYSGLFNMLALSDRSPWAAYPRFTLWHQDYGRPYSIRINGLNVNKYDRTQEEKVLADVGKYTVTITRKEAGHRHEATDRLVELPLTRRQDKMYRTLKEDLILTKKGSVILADTPAKLMIKLHQISGGFVKADEGSDLILKKNPKIKWLQENIDPDKTIILAHYQAEQEHLATLFPHTGSITKNAEGIDFSHFDRMVIYSMSFSAATYEQVRARQMNFSREKPIEIIYLLSGIDAYIYKAVSNKKNFTARWYR